MKTYDLIFITNLPAFYKVNLYNLIAKKRKILIIFIGDNSTYDRNNDFTIGEKKFEYYDLRSLSITKKIAKLISVFSRLSYKELILGGIDSIIAWFCAFILEKKKNALVVESSIFESKTDGFKGQLKKLFMKRISKVYASGKYQILLVKKLNFRGKIIQTNGVGIFNIIPQPSYVEKDKVQSFVYVGRLSSEKNLISLIEIFNKLPNLILNIIGYGPMENILKSISSFNIIFHGAIANKDLPKIYQDNDVFILPSLSEPWGLVVEEALNSGLPVIISDKVGCRDTVVREGENGLIFSLSEPDSLRKTILKICDINLYNKFRFNISKYDFSAVAQKQVNCYL